MKKHYILFLMVFATANIYSQTYTINFTAIGAATTLDSVKVENLTHPASTTWYAGDIFQLVLSNGINEISVKNENFQIFPNPMQGQAQISFYAKQDGIVTLIIYDIAGKEVLKNIRKLLKGTQNYQLDGLKQGIYFINIIGNDYFYTTKVISQNNTTNYAKVKYIGNEKQDISQTNLKGTKAVKILPYTIADNLRFIGYAGSLTLIENDMPTSSKIITFNFTITGITTVLIPAGNFTIGSPTTELNHVYDETQCQVSLSAFKMSKYEITNAQFAAFLNAKSIGSNGIYAAGAFPLQRLIYVSSGSYNWGLYYNGAKWAPFEGFENHPVIKVTWYGAAEFATYAGGFLPTEAQWEYSCRANTNQPYYTGFCLSNTQANYDWQYPYDTCTNSNTTYLGTTQTVGSYPANAYGLHDMHGNLWEWCSDWYSSYYSVVPINPTGAPTGTCKVLRGGSWNYLAKDCRSAKRSCNYPESNNIYMGFRIAFIP